MQPNVFPRLADFMNDVLEKVDSTSDSPCLSKRQWMGSIVSDLPDEVHGRRRESNRRIDGRDHRRLDAWRHLSDVDDIFPRGADS